MFLSKNARLIPLSDVLGSLRFSYAFEVCGHILYALNNDKTNYVHSTIQSIRSRPII